MGFHNLLIFCDGFCVCRSLTRCMEVAGNVWWVLTLVVSSLMHLGLSYTFPWRPSISLSTREPLRELIYHIKSMRALGIYTYLCNQSLCDIGKQEFVNGS